MTSVHCKKCGAELAEGQASSLCPRCALAYALDRPTDEGTPGAGHAPPARAEMRIGRYELIEKIGEGGMGEVWLAQQSEPVRRRVALKIVKHGMDSANFVTRFEGERQALALMDHRAVARILDAGTTPQGRPYFVMEHVPGVPITDFCDRQRLTTRQRLELFREVCDGVQHAHQKAIIHRDLKPSNVLVSMQDGKPTPKIIDFGVAKALEQKLTERTLFTELGVLIGTPEYMSPEQAGAGGDDVDTRTDVYSLGVMLYELLSGMLPFDSETLRASGYEGIRRVIREEEPPKPSARVDDDAGSPAERRRTDPVSLSRQIRGDLDWITMKALEKDPQRRYGSSADLAADIGRHLDNEPVLAGPPSAVYRAQKFVRRHRTSVAVACTIVVLMIVGLVATTTLWREARANRMLAEDRFDQVIRLSDLKRIRDYAEEADALWPAHPRNVAALRRWLEQRGHPLEEALPLHRETLAALRTTAHPYDDAQRAHDLESHRLAGDLRDTKEYVGEVEAKLERLRTDAAVEDREAIIAHYEGRRAAATQWIEEVETLVTRRRTWLFDDEQTQWQHEMLTDLVEQLETFTDPDPFVGVVASVRKRLEFAETIEERTLTGTQAAEAWARAVEAIGRSPDYAGLELEPQLGLFPLGQDPRSGLWEFWHPATGARPQPNPDPGGASPWDVTPETGVVFVLLPGGSFWMGAQKNDPAGQNHDPDAGSRERVIRRITLSPFFMSKYETTQAQWERLTGGNPSRYSEGSEWGDKIVQPDHPVETLSWEEATLTLERHALMLPTEAQWEYAARAGTATPWWTGRDKSSLRGAANLRDLFFKNNRGRVEREYEEWLDDGYSVHAPAGTYRPNAFGLHEMIGNVSEWCRDYYRSPYRKKVEPGDGLQRSPGGTASRIVRGGNWNARVVESRSAYRGNKEAAASDASLGVRAVMPIVE